MVQGLYHARQLCCTVGSGSSRIEDMQEIWKRCGSFPPNTEYANRHIPYRRLLHDIEKRVEIRKDELLILLGGAGGSVWSRLRSESE